MAKTDSLLIELGCEELPAKLTPILADKLARQLDDQLQAHQLDYEKVQWLATPRRIGLVVNNLNKHQPNQTIERYGPNESAAFDKLGKPTKAAQGFAKSCGVTVDSLTIKNGRLLFKQISAGQATRELLPNIIEQALQHPSGIKAMQWGTNNRHQFLRPVRWLVALYGKQALPLNLFDCQASAYSYGHRVHYNQRIRIKHPDQYIDQLKQQAHIMVDATERMESIRQQLHQAAPAGTKTIIDQSLLEEVTYLIEWPVILHCQYDKAYLSLPNQLLISVLHSHQKCFHTVSKKNQHQLAPSFMVVANLVSNDPSRVIDGNQRVVHARLADAKFCFDNDSSRSLLEHGQQLKTITFQHKLGSLADKVTRIDKLSAAIAKQIHVDLAQTKLAASLCKADLCCETVNEFPELSGIIGHALALREKLPAAVAETIRDYTKPTHAQDAIPTTGVACAVSIADKIDTLVGLFGINQPPTGTKDPFALRRAALGVVRIIISNQLTLPLETLIKKSATNYGNLLSNAAVTNAVLQFILDRLGSWYADQGINANVFQAVSSCKLTNLLDIDHRMRAVQSFMSLPEAASLIAANKRVSQLLKKSNTVPKRISTKLFESNAERTLANQLNQKLTDITPLVNNHDYTAVLTQLAQLQQPIDDFFDNVMVMTENSQLRNNRLALLNKLHQAFCQIANIAHLN